MSPPSSTYMAPRNLFTSGSAMGETAISVTIAIATTATARPPEIPVRRIPNSTYTNIPPNHEQANTTKLIPPQHHNGANDTTRNHHECNNHNNHATENTTSTNTEQHKKP